MPGNGEIASLLSELARLTVLDEGSPQSFRVRAYESAARAVETAGPPVAELSESELVSIRGIGRSTARKIREFVETGSIARLETLRSRFPPDFLQLTRIPGVGPKTAVLLRDRLGVGSVDDLRGALERHEVRTLPGMGTRTEENLLRAIDRLGIGGKERRTPIAEAIRVGRDVAEAVSAIPGVERAEVAGSLRRFRETVGDIDVIVVSTGDPEAIMERFVTLPVVRDVVASGARKSAIIGASGLQVDLRVVRPEQFGAAAVYFTGSKAHNVHLRRLALERGWTLNEYALSSVEDGTVIASTTEEEVYRALGMVWVPPELREDAGEIELAADGALPGLVDVGDLRGDLHVHTDLSGDGRESLEAMVAACAARRYAYVAITDHGEDLTINGASRDEMLAQREQITRLREVHAPMEILHGVELNIGPDGGIDYDAGFLEGFDWGVAAVHSHFDLDPARQTDRIVTAMRNPAVNVIGHPTGRRIGMRPGIEFDLDAVLEAAEGTGCALEVNCHLDRLDLPAGMLQRARRREAVFTISTDAHDTGELGNLRWGVRNARRGWVPADRVANTWDAGRFRAWAAAKRGA
jgi:DNA polymerase (family 10)